VKKRALEGKDTDVYLHGRRIDPKRVKREIVRYTPRIESAQRIEDEAIG
jgi:hypothetical protein